MTRPATTPEGRPSPTPTTGPHRADATIGAPGRAPSARRDVLLLAALLLLVALPLLVAVGVLHQPRWYPQADDAQTELRVRDVGTSHPPLTGLGGRIGTPGIRSGSHPGPMSFWSLAIPYRLLGSGSWALHAATAALNVTAMGLTLWMAHRRGGAALVVAMAAVLSVLTTAYSTFALTLPWNPYLPILWWVVAVVAVWSVLCGDLPTLPVAVVATSFCLQTHISYVGLGAGLSALGVVGAGGWLLARRRDGPARRRALRWIAGAAVLGAVLWFPPVAEQLTGSQGHNVTIIADHFGSPPEEPVGLGRGVDLLVTTLNPLTLLTTDVVADRPFLGMGSPGPGWLLIGTWAVAVAVAGILRHGRLLRLHAVLAVVLVLGVISTSRIFGAPWGYLALWGWSTGALLVLSVAWTAVAGWTRLVTSATGRPRGSRLAPAATVVAVVVLGGLSVRAVDDAAHTERRHPEQEEASATLTPEVVEVLEQGALPGTGRSGRYLVTWSDPTYGGARGFSLFDELDREGLAVGSPKNFRSAVTRHRVMTPDEATARVHLSAGGDIERWEGVAGTRRIASYDPSGVAGREEYLRLRRAVVDEVEDGPEPERVSLVDSNVAALRAVGGLSPAGRARVERMVDLGQPIAVFVAPPDALPA